MRASQIWIVSRTARAAIEARGGTVTVGDKPRRAEARRERAAAKLASQTARGEAPKPKASAVEEEEPAAAVEETTEPAAED